MRKIVTFSRVAADGSFAGPDGSLGWVVPDDEVDAAGVAGIPDTDTMLFGRKTYEQFESYWPHALGETPSDPHMPGRRSPAIKAMATWINDATKVVFSRSRNEVTWSGSRLVHELDPGEIEAMKRGPGKNMIVFGSGSIVSQLTRHRLVDEYVFVVSPVFVGGGRRLLGDVPGDQRLELLETKSYDSGNVWLRYGVT
jgi:dihydrofolate reductase